MLATISGGFKLELFAGTSWMRTLAAGNPGGITTAWRDEAYQKRLHDGWVARLPGYNFALPPGTSLHEKGLAVDVDGNTAGWLVANGRAHGWQRTPGWNAPNIANPEWWHFEYTASNDTHAHNATSAPAITETPQEDDDMRLLRVKDTQTVYCWGVSTGAWFKSPSEGATWSVGEVLPEAKVQDVTIDQLKQIADVASETRKALSVSTPTDYARLAKAVNDDAHERMKG